MYNAQSFPKAFEERVSGVNEIGEDLQDNKVDLNYFPYCLSLDGRCRLGLIVESQSARCPQVKHPSPQLLDIAKLSSSRQFFRIAIVIEPKTGSDISLKEV